MREGKSAPGLLFSSEHATQLSIIEIVKWPLWFVSATNMFSSLHSITNEEHYEKGLCNQSSHNGKPITKVGKSSHSTTMNRHLALLAKINGTQRRTQVSP